MNQQELNDDMNNQAQTALAFLEYTRMTVTGGEDPILKQPLTKDEENVKDSALTCLMSYFGKDLDRSLTTIFKPNKIEIPSEVKKELKKLNTKKQRQHGQRH